MPTVGTILHKYVGTIRVLSWLIWRNQVFPLVIGCLVFSWSLPLFLSCGFQVLQIDGTRIVGQQAMFDCNPFWRSLLGLYLLQSFHIIWNWSKQMWMGIWILAWSENLCRWKLDSCWMNYLEVFVRLLLLCRLLCLIDAGGCHRVKKLFPGKSLCLLRSVLWW